MPGILLIHNTFVFLVKLLFLELKFSLLLQELSFFSLDLLHFVLNTLVQSLDILIEIVSHISLYVFHQTFEHRLSLH